MKHCSGVAYCWICLLFIASWDYYNYNDLPVPVVGMRLAEAGGTATSRRRSTAARRRGTPTATAAFMVLPQKQTRRRRSSAPSPRAHYHSQSPLLEGGILRGRRRQQQHQQQRVAVPILLATTVDASRSSSNSSSTILVPPDGSSSSASSQQQGQEDTNQSDSSSDHDEHDVEEYCTRVEEVMLNSILDDLNVISRPWGRQNVSKNRRNRRPWSIRNRRPKRNILTFNYVLSVLADYNHDDQKKDAQEDDSMLQRALQAETVLRYLLDQEKKDNSAGNGLRPNILSLNTVLRAYSKAVVDAESNNKQTKLQIQRIAADAAYKLFQEWQDKSYSENNNWVVVPEADLISYNTMISILGKAQLPDEAEDVFKQLQERSSSSSKNETNNSDDNNSGGASSSDDTRRGNTNNSDIVLLEPPDVISYTSLLHANAKVGRTERVSELFRHMRNEGPKPNIHAYHDVLYSYANSKLHPEHAEEFLLWWLMESQRQDEKLLHSRDSGGTTTDHDDHDFVRPNVQSFNIVLHSMGQIQNKRDVAARSQQLFATMPERDTMSYTTVIHTICKRSMKNNKKSLEAALEAVEDIWEQALHDKNIRINAAFVSNILYSLANLSSSSNMPYLAERIVEQAKMDDDLLICNGLLHCWAKAARNNEEAPERVLQILRHVEESSTMRPDTRTYTNVLDALKQQQQQQQTNNDDSDSVFLDTIDIAEDLVTKMELQGPKPTVHSYTTLIGIYGRSNLSDKATRAYDVLQRMTENRIEPTMVSYNAVLNACGDASEDIDQQQALKIACTVFDEVRSLSAKGGNSANHITYAAFLHAITALMPIDARQQIAELVFKRCCHDGQVSGLVLKKLRLAAHTQERYTRLLRGHKEEKLPSSWTDRIETRRARDM